MSESNVFFLVGPTAVGKSEIATLLGPRLNAEIISCDALQVYREINIASDKPSPEALRTIPHHLINAVSVTEDFNVARYRQLALAAMEDIHARGKKVLFVGGSGMYMSVLLDGIFEGIDVDEDVRTELAQELLVKGPMFLHERLKTLDPAAAAKIHPNDPQRILRALQVVLSTGQPISQLQPKREGIWDKMPVKMIAVDRPREELYNRVEARIDAMFAKGLVEEIKHVLTLPVSVTAAKLIGIPEIKGHLNGAYDLERAKYLMKLNTRHYVKRQLTWFRRDKRLEWINIEGQSSVEVAEVIWKKLF